MAINTRLNDRSNGTCELCNTMPAIREFTVSPRSSEAIENLVALCETCLIALSEKENSDYWRFLEGSIWNPEPVVQALSYRILHSYKDLGWAESILSSAYLDEDTIQWALSAFAVADVPKDAFGNLLQHGDTIVLTQALNVRGTNFTAAKRTIVKRIKLVADNTEQIEGKVNGQTIVILTKFVKKG